MKRKYCRTRGARIVTLFCTAALAGPAQAEVEYTIIDLGSVPADAYNTIPRGLNNNGEAVGWRYDFDHPNIPYYRGWKWTPSEGMTLLPPSSTGNVNYAGVDITDEGMIGGDSIFDFSEETWRYESGAYFFPGLLPGHTWASLTDINAEGDMVGYGDNFSPGTGAHAFFFFSDETGLLEIVDPPGGSITGIGQINDEQVAVGRSSFGAFRWTLAGGFEFLPHPTGYSMGFGINNAGDVAGEVAIGNEKYGAVFTDATGWQLIANIALPGCCSDPRHERGVAINNKGVVVGFSQNPEAGTAWVWSAADGLRLLDDVIDPAAVPSWFHLYQAVDINDSGQILAKGTALNGGLNGAFLLTPIEPEPKSAADTNADGVVNSDDVLVVINAWGECPPVPVACPADVNGDGTVNFDDLLMVIGDWS